MSPQVSIVMAVRDGARYLPQALDSLFRQSLSDFELIVVDDGSRDGTRAVLDGCSDSRLVRLCNSQPEGLGAALNRGIELCRGEFVARQDADDWSLPERLAEQLDYLRAHPEVGLVGSAYHTCDEDGRLLGVCRQPETDTAIRWQMLFHNAFCHSSVLVRRGLLGCAGARYDPSLSYSQDYDLWARLLERTRAANLAAPLVVFRVHDASASSKYSAAQQRIASEIAARQIARLVDDRPPALETVSLLRQWFQAWPSVLGEEDLPACRLLVEMLVAFSRQPLVDPAAAGKLRRQWVAALGSTPGARGALSRPGVTLLSWLVRADPVYVLTRGPRSVARRAWRRVGSSTGG